MSKLSVEDYQAFQEKFDNGDFDRWRWGQALLNHFKSTCPHEVGDEFPCIFHEEDRGKAQKWIEQNGVDWEGS